MKLRMPHTLVLLLAGVLLAAALTWVIPAGQYDRHEVDGKQVVVPGTYHPVPAKPLGQYVADAQTPKWVTGIGTVFSFLFASAVQVPKGMEKAGDVIFFVFLVGGTFAVVDKTGTWNRAVRELTHRLRNHRGLIIPVVCVAFALGGALENLQEEIIAIVPVLLLLCGRLGYDPLTAVAMSIGSASVGSAFSPLNPFQAVIAQKFVGLAPFSAWGYRLGFAVIALGFWIWGVRRHAARNAVPAKAGPDEMKDEAAPGEEATPDGLRGWRVGSILAAVGATFILYVYGTVKWGWGFEEGAAAFFILGIAAGLFGGLGVNGTAVAFVEGFQNMTFAALLIGFAKTIYVVMDEGHVVDTVVAGLFSPLGHLPLAVSAIGMMILQAVVHVPVPSVSSQAVLTMPLLGPLSDLLQMSRQVVVLAYQYGAGLCELLTPTNAALMAILGAAGVRYDKWLRFVWPMYLGLVVLGMAAILIGIATGLK